VRAGRGLAAPDRGPRAAPHEATTRNLGAVYPLLTEGGIGHRGILVGRDLLGGSFVYDPFELYRQGVLSNPNMVVFGQIGRGKSAFVKSYLWRQAVFGRRAWVVDPKGEYHSLARAWGVRPVALRPGGPVRLNPLEPVASGEAVGGTPFAAHGGPADQRLLAVLDSLAETALGRALAPRERTALELALVSVQGTPTLPAVVEALLEPDPEVGRGVRTGQRELAQDGRDVALELRRMVHGDLRGMFDGPTSPGIDLSGPLVVLDLSALYGSPALGVLMVCATAWLQAGLIRRASGAGGGHVDPVILVVDEAWAILANLGVARWLQSSWKLARAYGVANVAVLHRLSDLLAVGARGSEAVGLATGLLADSETRVVYAQSSGEVERAAEHLALSATEALLLPQLRRGVALWKVGQRAFLVQHVLSAEEHGIVDTDHAMRATS